MAHWEARTADAERMQTEFALCINALETINRLWDISEDEDKQGMVRQLFDYIVFDLDRQQVVDFRLKAWADQFLMIRVEMLRQENNGENYYENRMTLTGYPPYTGQTIYIEFTLVRVPRRLAERVSYPQIALALGLSQDTIWALDHS